jgi:hypothetical protein
MAKNYGDVSFVAAVLKNQGRDLLLGEECLDFIHTFFTRKVLKVNH